jgi:hypothetical protein
LEAAGMIFIDENDDGPGETSKREITEVKGTEPSGGAPEKQ